MHTKDNKDDWNVSISKQTEPEIPLVRKLPVPNLEIRLQQAAHILVNGAIRAALKQRIDAVEKPTKRTLKPPTEQMSDIQTSPDFYLEAKETTAYQSPKKPSKMTPIANDNPQSSNGSKDLPWQEARLGSKS